MNDVTLSVENTKSIKAGNVNVDEEYVDVNTDVDVDADAVGLSCLSDWNDMTLAVEADTSRLCLCRRVNVDVNFNVN